MASTLRVRPRHLVLWNFNTAAYVEKIGYIMRCGWQNVYEIHLYLALAYSPLFLERLESWQIRIASTKYRVCVQLPKVATIIRTRNEIIRTDRYYPQTHTNFQRIRSLTSWNPVAEPSNNVPNPWRYAPSHRASSIHRSELAWMNNADDDESVIVVVVSDLRGRKLQLYTPYYYCTTGRTPSSTNHHRHDWKRRNSDASWEQMEENPKRCCSNTDIMMRSDRIGVLFVKQSVRVSDPKIFMTVWKKCSLCVNRRFCALPTDSHCSVRKQQPLQSSKIFGSNSEILMPGRRQFSNLRAPIWFMNDEEKPVHLSSSSRQPRLEGSSA